MTPGFAVAAGDYSTVGKVGCREPLAGADLLGRNSVQGISMQSGDPEVSLLASSRLVWPWATLRRAA